MPIKRGEKTVGVVAMYRHKNTMGINTQFEGLKDIDMNAFAIEVPIASQS